METQAELERANAPASSRVPPQASSLAAKIEVAVIGILLAAAFWPILISMYGSWFDEKTYMEHGILVMPAAAYMAWAKKDNLKTIQRQPSAWGVLFLLAGAMQAILGIAAQWTWVSRMAFLV